MAYQNTRGGRVRLYSVVAPLSEFYHAEKGDALHAMELALSLEKLTNEKLLKLYRVAEKANDPQLQDFIESEFLAEQVESIKKIAEYVTQLRMVGKGGHGKNKIRFQLQLSLQFFCPQPVEVSSSPYIEYICPGNCGFKEHCKLAGLWHFDQQLLHEGEAA
ncbi:Dysferlin [Dionaea muscipula]